MKYLTILLVAALICYGINSTAQPCNSVAGSASASADSICENTSTSLQLSGYNGSIQWQGFDGTGWINETGAGSTTDNYTVTISVNKSFRALVTDGSCPADSSNVVDIAVGVLSVPVVTGATRCGYGQVTLNASGTGTQRWYSSATGGNPLFVGNSYSTTVGQTTDFYVESSSSAGGGGAMMPLPIQSSSFSPWVRGYYFTAPVDFTISSLYVDGSGVQSIAVLKFVPAVPPPAYSQTTNDFVVLYLTQNNLATTPIPVNIQISAGDVIGVLGSRGSIVPYGTGSFMSSIAGYPVLLERMGMQASLDTNQPQDIWSEPGGSLGLVQITYEEGCTSPRVPVTATVTPTDPITVTGSNALCLGQSTTLNVSSNNSNYSYQWSPSTGLSGTSGPSVTAQPTTTITYSVIGTDGNCGAIDSIMISVGPTSQAGVISVSSDTICAGSPVILSLSGSVGNIQWQSNTGSGWINETSPGSDSAVYNFTPAVSANYQAVVTSGGCAPSTSAIVSVYVIAITDPVTVNDTLCGSGIASLSASGPGVLNWYTSPSGGTAVSSGTSYSPNVTSTTTYYVQAASGSSYYVGAPNAGIGAQNMSSSANFGLSFDVTAQSVIEKVTIEPAGTGNVIINLRQVQSGTILNTVTVPVTAFIQAQPTLNFIVNPGTGYRLELGAGSVQCYFNSMGASYPYTTPGSPVTITGYLAPGQTTGTYYYYFYNWKVIEGCNSNMVPVTAVVYPAVSTPVISQNGTQLTSSSASNNQWYLNGNAIPGATSQTITASLPGSYTVVVTDPATGCTAESQPIIISGITEGLPGSVLLFPNPASSVVYLDPGNSLTGEVSLQLKDVSGRLISVTESHCIPGKLIEVKLPESSGLYFVEIHTTDRIYLTKVVKE
ncbi:MAG: T9SS type A sorting domain-containing protein [Bacteroidia bacterium]|nr:T9SS type A sorting domain-containing protein [Bacteroidia bacterium]MCZ2276691.1 T9SS type A sorting domain-containing protein [Bacteroidia bacterium]